MNPKALRKTSPKAYIIGYLKAWQQSEDLFEKIPEDELNKVIQQLSALVCMVQDTFTEDDLLDLE